MHPGLQKLSPRQRELVKIWLPDATLERDHSWGLVGTVVLQLRDLDGALYIVKAGDVADHHISRELRAHRQWLQPWVSVGRAPQLVHGDGDAKLLVTRYLPGELVEGSDDEWEPGAYRQAGELLARFHDQCALLDDGEFERRQREETLGWLRRPHRIAAEVVARLRDEVESWPTPGTVVVPTHGDWQPRNWLIHEGTIAVIDFGRAALRPAHTDFGRLVSQQFLTRPVLETAFLDGYGADPREPDAWQRSRIREAVGTAAWAHQFGDGAYEAQGLQMIADILTEQ